MHATLARARARMRIRVCMRIRALRSHAWRRLDGPYDLKGVIDGIPARDRWSAAGSITPVPAAPRLRLESSSGARAPDSPLPHLRAPASRPSACRLLVAYCTFVFR
eukprot:COSAG02_NODE_1709_length_11226_cov_5.225937_7_plen_106_part_00